MTDLARSTAFSESPGWRHATSGGVAFFQCGPLALALYPRAALAEDGGLTLPA